VIAQKEVGTMLRKIDREAAKMLRIETENALHVIAQKYGLTVRVHGGRFGDADYIPKVEFKVIETEDGTRLEEAEFTARAAMYGIDQKYGEAKEMRGEMYRLVAISLTKRKFPVICQRMRDGKRYCFPVEAFKRTVGVEKYADQFSV
jgi:hypothetical protein